MSGEGSLCSQLSHTQHTMSLYSVPPSQTQSQGSSVHMQQHHQQQHSPIDSLSSPHYVPDMSHSCHTSVSSPELPRCKRRVDFNEHGNSQSQHCRPPTASRRNERERNRVRMVNNGFSTLRNHVPNGAKNKKMSKVETLRSAVEYIRELKKVLGEQQDDHHQAGNNMSNCQSLTSSSLATTSGQCRPSTSDSSTPLSSGSHSPLSLDSEDASSYGGRHEHKNFAASDEDLMSFSKWFS